MKNLLIVLALAGLASQASATIVSTSAYTATAVAFIAAPSNTGQQSKLKSCVLSNSSASNLCVTVAGQFTNDPSVMLCALSSTTVTLGGGYGQAQSPAAGGITAQFGEDMVSTGTWTAKESTLTAGLLLTCSYEFGRIR